MIEREVARQIFIEANSVCKSIGRAIDAIDRIEDPEERRSLRKSAFQLIGEVERVFKFEIVLADPSHSSVRREVDGD